MRHESLRKNCGGKILSVLFYIKMYYFHPLILISKAIGNTNKKEERAKEQKGMPCIHQGHVLSQLHMFSLQGTIE